MKERTRRLATGENTAAHGALWQANSLPPPAPNWVTIDELFGKDDLEDYFNNFAAAATNNKSVLGHLTTAIASLTTNNKKLVATNAKLIAEVTIITNRMVGKAANGGKATNRYVAKE